MIANTKRHQLDPDKIAGGAPVKIETDGDGTATIWVRRADARNVDFARARAELAALREDGELPDEFVRRCYPLLIARACVVGWDGFYDDEGQAVPCEEKAILWLFDHTSEIYEKVAEVASDAEAFRLEADTKSDH